MAYLPPQEENKNAPTGQTTTNPQTQIPPTSGGSAGAGAAPKAGATPGIGTSTQFGTSASKLGDYLSANAPQIQQQAQNLAGTLTSGYGNITGEIGQGVGQFGQAVKSGYAPFDQAAIDKAVQDALKGQVTPEQASGFQAQLKNQYAGPTAFEQTDPYSQIQSNVSQAAQQAQTLTTMPGIKSYYQSKYGNEPDPLATLDATLLANQPEAFGQVMEAAKPYSNLQNYLQSQTAEANKLVAPAQQEAQQGKQYTTGKFGEATSGYEQQLQDQLTNAMNQYDQYNKKINYIQSNLAVPATAFPGSSLANYFNLDPRLSLALSDVGQYNRYNPAETVNVPLASNYLSAIPAQPAPPVLANVATPENVATAQALAQLSGNQYVPPVTQPGYYGLPAEPTFNQQGLGNMLWETMSGMTPNFTQTQTPNEALMNWKAGRAQIREYLGLPAQDPDMLEPLPGQPPVTPPEPPVGPPYLQPPGINPWNRPPGVFY
jgi:hypothetical protein